jgi:hypothetical protein
MGQRKIKKWARYLLSGLLLFLLVNLMVNTFFNWHIHRLQCGKVISHSHPYNKATKSELPEKEFPKHQHSTKSLVFYQQLFDILTIGFAFILILQVLLKSFSNHQFYFSFLLLPVLFYQVNKYRGPPVE